MPTSAPSCPEHDAIAQLIRSNRAERDARADTGIPPYLQRLAHREDDLFAALAAVDGQRYTVLTVPNSVLPGRERPVTAYLIRDRWNDNSVVNVWANPATAFRQANDRNKVNIAARASELADELDGRTSPA